MSIPSTTAARVPAALRLFVLAIVADLVAYASALAPGGAPRWAAWLFAAGTVGAMTAITALGARRGAGGVGPLRWPLAITAALLLAGFGVALALPPVTAATPLLLGLPPAAAVMIYGVGLLPALVLPIAYARWFDAATLSADDLARLRAAARAGTDAARAGGETP
ncbi:MAG: hypothetical protein MUF53_08615 [Gemmatimonadaceae bacterium]|nr:hypothetical protein [Gemmatimonadaceae bacterium]